MMEDTLTDGTRKIADRSMERAGFGALGHGIRGTPIPPAPEIFLTARTPASAATCSGSGRMRTAHGRQHRAGPSWPAFCLPDMFCVSETSYFPRPSANRVLERKKAVKNAHCCMIELDAVIASSQLPSSAKARMDKYGSFQCSARFSSSCGGTKTKGPGLGQVWFRSSSLRVRWYDPIWGMDPPILLTNRDRGKPVWFSC